MKKIFALLLVSTLCISSASAVNPREEGLIRMSKTQKITFDYDLSDIEDGIKEGRFAVSKQLLEDGMMSASATTILLTIPMLASLCCAIYHAFHTFNGSKVLLKYLTA